MGGFAIWCPHLGTSPGLVIMTAPVKKTVELFYDVVSPYSWIAFEVHCIAQTLSIAVVIVVDSFSNDQWHCDRAINEVFDTGSGITGLEAFI